MYKFLFFYLISIIFVSCNDNESNSEIPQDNVKIDLNKDGINDFEIVFEQFSLVAPIDPDPGPYEIIRAKIQSLNNNKVLTNENKNSILYLNDPELIEINVTSPLFWNELTAEYPSTIVSKSQNMFDKSWPDEWTINNEEVKELYTVGFMLVGLQNAIGYFQLFIDSNTAEVTIEHIEFI